jgi:uncharacterized oxidoreductase
MPVYQPDYLQDLSSRIFQALGASKAEGDRTAELLVEANLAGHDSHGVIRIPQYVGFLKEGQIVPGAAIRVENETPSTAVIDGNWGFGQTIATAAADMAIRKARDHAVSVVTVYHCNHIGRLGSYGLQIARADMVGMLTANGHGGARSVAPFGGTGRRLSTNPLAIAAPSGGEPLVLDITTSVVAEGKVRVKRNRGEPTPPGWIIDSEGNPTTDPNKLYGPPPGAILPFGGHAAHKGYGLSVIVDILSGALSAAGCSRPDVSRIANAVFVMVLNPTAFTTLDLFKRQVDDFVAYLKSSPTAPGFQEILVPGEVELREERRRRKEGIFVEDETWRQIEEVARAHGVSV